MSEHQIIEAIEALPEPLQVVYVAEWFAFVAALRADGDRSPAFELRRQVFDRRYSGDPTWRVWAAWAALHPM